MLRPLNDLEALRLARRIFSAGVDMGWWRQANAPTDLFPEAPLNFATNTPPPHAGGRPPGP